MKPLQPQESKQTSENQSTTEASNDCQSKQHNNTTSLLDPDPASSSTNKKVTKEDIQIVQNLIEGCMVKYMNQNEVIKTLWNQEFIDPAFTALVWQKLEERNAEFFRDYNIRLELIKQIRIFNYLLECQNDVMLNLVLAPPNAPFTPTLDTVNPMPANNLPMHHADNSPQPTGVNSKLGTMMGTCSVEAPPVIPSTSICGSRTLDGALPCIKWGLPDLNNPANLADIEPLENYPRSPFLPSPPNIDSPELVEKYFTDLDIVNGFEAMVNSTRSPSTPTARLDKEKP